MSQEKDIPIHQSRVPHADKEAQSKVQAAKEKEIRDDLAFVFGTEQGIRALRLVMNICGYKQSKVGGNPALGMDVLVGTMYNSAREGIYLELRRFIPRNIVNKVEAEQVNEIE